MFLFDKHIQEFAPRLVFFTSLLALPVIKTLLSSSSQINFVVYQENYSLYLTGNSCKSIASSNHNC